MTGYVRQSAASILPTLTIKAEDVNAEFNQIESAFNSSVGHRHTGGVGEGPQISLTAAVTGILPIANGGTGASTASTARSSIGANDASNLNTGTIPDARLNTILQATTASFTTTLKTKLDGIEAGATGDQTATEILTLLKTVDTNTSGLNSQYLGSLDSAYHLNRANHTGTQLANTISNLSAVAVSGSYNDLANKPSAVLYSGQTLSTSEKAQARANLDLDDPWLFQPIGVYIPIFKPSSGNILPATTGKPYRYILLTASSSYNSGVLVSQNVSGSDPTVTATAVVSLSGSPLNGQTVHLLNTERRFLRAGTTGAVEDSANLAHTHTASSASAGSHTHTGTTFSSGSHTHSGTANSAGAHAHDVGASYIGSGTGSNGGYILPSGTGAITSTGGSHTHTLAINSSGDHTHTLSVNASGDHTHTITINSTGGTESRPRNLSVEYIMRIL